MEDAHGYINYEEDKMEVEITCTDILKGSGGESLGGYLFYSGVLGFDSSSNEVIHYVEKFSDPSLDQIFRRKVEKDSIRD